MCDFYEHTVEYSKILKRNYRSNYHINLHTFFSVENSEILQKSRLKNMQ